MAVGFKPYLSWGQNRRLRPSGPAVTPWYLANGSISASNVAYHGESVAAGTLYPGATITGDSFYAVRWTLAAPGSNIDMMYSTELGATRVYLQHTSTGYVRVYYRVGGVLKNTGLGSSQSDGSHVVFVGIDSSNGAYCWVDNVFNSSNEVDIPTDTEWDTTGHVWLSSAYTTAELIAVYDTMLDAGQRAALYATMSA